MSDPQVRFGVLGLGRIGKIHAANLATRIPGTAVTALSDSFPESLAAATASLNHAKAFSDYRQVLELAEVDAVAICTPTDTHFQIILDAAAAGKHIFCEKPVDLSLEKIAAINRVVEANDVELMVGFNRRYDGNFLKVHDAVRGGEIGDPQILRITSRDPAPPPESYIRSSGGIFLDMTIHDFDMARYLIGSEVVEVFAKGNVLVDAVFERAGDWDTAIVMLTFANGAMGAIDNSRKAVYGYDQRVEVFGSAGMIAIGNNIEDSHIRLDRTGAHSALPLNFFMERYNQSYLAEMQAFVQALHAGQPAPVSGNDCLIAVQMGLAAALSAKENRPVRLSEIPGSHA